MADLQGRSALIVGGSQGIGLAIARKFIAAGARIMVVARQAGPLAAAQRELGTDLAIIAGDAAAEDTADQCIDEALRRFARIDILVNNAALNPQKGPTIELPLDDFDAVLRLNLRAPLMWSQKVWRASMKEHGGVILNMSSLGGRMLYPDMGGYNTSKAALIYLTKVLAAELGPRVRVNGLAPGLIRTEMSESAWRDGRGERFAARLPLQRLGEARDVARSALFLVGDDADWITGETMTIDGGTAVALGRRTPRDGRPGSTRE
jgi:NAD(P)-dependent dehydrogenase (short-subunit alcohol dehydrogenase family)